jgi:hypothetical protein
MSDVLRLEASNYVPLVPPLPAANQSLPYCVRRTLRRTLSPQRRCERSEAIQSLAAEMVWIASLRARNDGVKRTRPRLLAAHFARALLNHATLIQEGAGKAGCRLAPAGPLRE